MATKKKTPARKAASKAKPVKSAKKPARKTAAKSPAKKIKAIPDGMTAVTPHLVCAGAAEAIAFYKAAFNAVEEGRLPGPGGKIIHAQVRVGGAPVMLVDEMPEWGALGPKALKGSPVTIHLYVDDVDATVAQAVKAGAKVTMPVADMFWGDRYGKVEDPFGHQWSIATHQRDVPVGEMQEAMKKLCDPAATAG
jgi:PhnB protein